MRLRILLLIAGFLFIGTGAWLAWSSQATTPLQTRADAPARAKAEILVARVAIQSGALLRPNDLSWKEIDQTEVAVAYLERNQTTLQDFYGAIARRDFAAGEAFNAADLLKASDRRFLSAVLQPNRRAASISVDSTQTASGLVLPGDRVDVILIQSLNASETDFTRKSVGETVLHNLRILAVDQTLNIATAKPAAPPEAALLTGELRVPRTVTLEVSEAEAETLFVAASLGKLQLAVRPLESAPAAKEAGHRQTWASDVSPALKQASAKPATAVSSGSGIEAAIRRPPSTYQ